MNIDQLQYELSSHPDKTFVNYLVNGLRYGFNTKVKNTDLPTKECKNLQSALRQHDVVTQLLELEVSKGFISGPFDNPPFDSYRVSPIGVATGKYSNKKRLILDLSSPHNDNNHQSINDLIDKEECSLTYVRIDDAIKQIVKYGSGSLMCKTDISDAFKVIPISPSEYHLFCVKWLDKYYFYNRLAFGCRSSPKIFDQLSSAICWIAEHRYNINFILHLLDDFLTIDKPSAPADQTMEKLMFLFKKLNIPIAQHKTTGPTTVIEYLGIILDSDKMEARLPQQKLERIGQLLKEFSTRKNCTKRELLQLLGHLAFASRVIPSGRSFISYLLAMASSVRELHHFVHLGAQCREDIHMWTLFLQQWNGVSMFHDISITKATDMSLYTDAASTIGHGGIFQDFWFCETWPSDIPLLTDDKMSMAFQELYPIVVAAILWGHFWTNKRILFYCDNAATVSIICKGRSKVLSIMLLMRRLTWCALKGNFSIYAEHVPGKDNSIADSLSRLQMNRFRQLAPTARPTPCICPPVSEVMWNSKSHLNS